MTLPPQIKKKIQFTRLAHTTICGAHITSTTNVMVELAPDDLKLGDNITKKEVGWETLLQTFSEILDKENTVGDVICFSVSGNKLRIVKSGNDHLVPQIQKFLEAGTKDMEDICIGENTESFEWDIADEKLHSSNDALLFDSSPAHLKSLGLAVYALQIAVLGVVISSSYKKDTVEARSADLILVRIFISSYLSFHLADSMSKFYTRGLGRAMELFVYPFPVGSWGETMSNVIAAPPAFILLVVLTLFLTLYGLACNDKTYLPTASTIAETIIECLMLLATSIITKQQSGILDSVFNFVGLILDLDELVVKFTSFTVKKRTTFSTTVIRTADKAKFAVSIYFFIGLVIYLMV
jgi:hypothetical protein